MATAGVISDTHGWLRDEAVAALQGCEMILHAGDIGKPEILERLQEIAPVMAVRGNVDEGAWARELPLRRIVQVGDARVLLLHDVARLRIDPEAEGLQAVVFGHSHRPLVEERNGVLFLNPGAAGPRRFTLPVSVALLNWADRLSAELVTLPGV